MKYKLNTNHKRRENGKDLMPGDITELKHLTAEQIVLLVRIGIYKEVKQKGDK